jgi:hypothetical protein
MKKNPPKVFISYSHDSPGHKQWVLKLASDLRKNGVDAVLDQWDLSPGEDITHFMESGLRGADRVVVICSEQYVIKANEGKGGVGYEKMIVSAELIENLGTKKFIPIIRKAGNPPVPKFLGYRLYIDFENDNTYATSLEELLREIHDVPTPTKPPIGHNPFNEHGETVLPVIEPISLPTTEVVGEEEGEVEENIEKEEITKEDLSDQLPQSLHNNRIIVDLKSILSDPNRKMELYDFIVPRADNVRQEISKPNLIDISNQPTLEEFLLRMLAFEKSTAELVDIFATGCFWANSEQIKIFGKALSRLMITPNVVGTYYPSWLPVLRYSALRVFYAGGIGAFGNDSFETLKHLAIQIKTKPSIHDPEKPWIEALFSDAGFAQNIWKWLPKRDRHFMPLSDFLQESLRTPFNDLYPDDEEFIKIFDRFEFFISLLYADIVSDSDESRVWTPLGSYVWRRRSIFKEIEDELAIHKDSWPPFSAGLFNSSVPRVKELIDKVQEFVGRVRSQMGIF